MSDYRHQDTLVTISAAWITSFCDSIEKLLLLYEEGSDFSKSGAVNFDPEGLTNIMMTMTKQAE